MLRLLIVLFLLAAAPTWAAGLFGTVEIKGNKLDSFTKWLEVLGRIRAQRGVLEGCYADDVRCNTAALQKWKTMMTQAAEEGARAQLDDVNSFFNGWVYIEDIDNYGKSDLWATPLEFMRRSGDCEDYAIAKFITLRLLGWSNGDLRVVILQDRVRGVPHAVLAARAGGDEMILDNLAKRPLPSQTVIQYSPYYAVNETTRWIFVKPTQ